MWVSFFCFLPCRCEEPDLRFPWMRFHLTLMSTHFLWVPLSPLSGKSDWLERCIVTVRCGSSHCRSRWASPPSTSKWLMFSLFVFTERQNWIVNWTLRFWEVFPSCSLLMVTLPSKVHMNPRADFGHADWAITSSSVFDLQTEPSPAVLSLSTTCRCGICLNGQSRVQ